MADFVAARLIALRVKLLSRQSIPGYAENCRQIQEEIDRLEAPNPVTPTAIAKPVKGAE